MQRIYFLLIFLFVNVMLFGQANDDCLDAELITDLDGTCNNYNNTGATTDLLNGDCTADGDNVWFEFTADGPDVTISVDDIGGIASEITLVSFDPNPCEFSSATQLACDRTEIVVTNLTPGETYYIIITNGAGNEGNFDLCVDNPVEDPPANDDPCDAQVITPNGSCTMGTTVDANPDWVDGSCSQVDGDNSVWYQFDLGPGMNQVEFNIDYLDITGDVSLLIGTFNPDCNGNLTLNGSACGPIDGTTLTVTGLTPGTTYYIGVISDNDNEGTFNLCVTESGADDCVDNDECEDANIIDVATGGGQVCYPGGGCNLSASPGPSLGAGCYDFPNNTVWYQVNTDGTANSLTITVESSDLDQPQIAILNSNDCNTFGLVDCNVGSGGFVSIIAASVATNNTYYIAVSDLAGDEGFFEICAIVETNNSQCVTDAEIIVTPLGGSPPEGPFAPGEDVQFCFNVNNFNNLGCNWFQGIVPKFGNCWDPASFLGDGQPLIWSITQPPGSIGSWSWWPEGAVDYNGPNNVISTYVNPDNGNLEICSPVEPDCPNDGLMDGDPMPGGWYAITPGGTNPPEPDNDDNPDDAYGDGPPGGGCPQNQSGWELCFTLTAKDNAQCDEDGDGEGEPENTDCSVSIMTFADGEIGDWQNFECQGEIPTYFNASLNCCIPPIAMADGPLVICSGGQTAIVLTSDVPGSSFQWTVVGINPFVEGASGGEGTQITQILTNTNPNISQFVTYEIRALSPDGCLSDPIQFTVEVLPGLVADVGEDIDGCQCDPNDPDSGFQLNPGNASASGGAPPYMFDWGNPSVENIGNPVVCPTLTTTYVVTVTDANGCTATDDVTLFILPNFDVAVDGPPEICAETPTEIYTATASGGTPNYSYEWDNPVGSSSSGSTYVFSTDGVAPGTYTITVSSTDANGCTGELEYDILIHNTPEMLINSNPNPPAICAGSSQTINLTISEFGSDGDPDNHVYDWSGPNNTTYSGDDIIVGEGGTYTVTVTDEFGCTATASIEVTEEPNPEPTIDGPITACDGQTITLTADDGFDEYLWDNGEMTQSIDVAPTGVTTYTVTVTDSNGCTGTDSHDVTPGASPEPSISGSLSFCVNSSTTLDAGPGFASYDWGNGNMDQTLVVDTPGDYTVIVSDDEGCTGSDMVTVEELENLSPVIGGDLSICPDVATTTLDAGSGFDVYEWGGGEDTQTIDVGPGTYSVTVTDNTSGCTGESSVMVVENTPPSPDITGDLELCPDGETSSLDAGAGYATYDWGDMNSGQTLNVDTSGTYTVIVTDDEGCTGSSSVEVVILTAPEPMIEGDLSFCPGGMTTLNTTTGFELYELDNDNNGTIDVSSDQPIQFDVDDERTINLIVTDANGCTGSTSVTTMIFDQPMPTLIDTATYCIGGSVTINAEGGYTEYEWFNSSNTSVGNDQSISIGFQDTYTLVVTDANGCTGTTSTVVIQSTELTPTIVGENSICDGIPTTLDAGSGFETYLWSTNEDTQTIDVSSANQYTVTVTDASGCSGTDVIEVSENTSPVANVTAEITVCNNADAPQGTSFSFIDQVMAGSDPGSWSDTDGLGIDLSDLSNVDFLDVPAGQYTFTYTTNIAIAPCEEAAPTMLVTVIECTCPAVLDANDLCNSGGTIDLTTLETLPPSGTWSLVGGPGSNPLNGNIFDATGVLPGDYTVRITFDNPDVACDETADVVITVSEEPAATVTALIDGCNNMDATQGTIINFNDYVSGSAGVWTDPNGTGIDISDPSSVDFLGAAEGVYTFTYTTNTAVPPCTDQSYEMMIDIAQCLCPSVVTIPGGPLCSSGGTLDLSTLSLGADPGSWSFVSGPGADPLTGSIFDATGLVAGDYIVRYTLDTPADGCDEFSEQTITVLDPPNPGVPTDDLRVCLGDTDVVSLADLLDGEDLGGMWMETSSTMSTGSAFNAGAGTFDVSGQSANTYTFEYVVSGAAPCTDQSETVVVIIEELPIADAGMDQEISCGQPSVTLGDLSSASGPNIEYMWTEQSGKPISDPTTLQINVTEDGIYTLMVTDINTNCFSTDEVVVSLNSDFPSISLEGTDPSCFGDSDGTVTVASTTGGTPGYEYSIDGGANFTTDDTFQSLSSGSYTVIVRDAAGCTSEQTLNLSEPLQVSVDIGSDFTVNAQSPVEIAFTSNISNDLISSIIWTVEDSVVCDDLGCLSIEAELEPNITNVCIEIRDENGCPATDCIQIRVLRERKLYVPNVFSPNDDAANNVFFVQGGPDLIAITDMKIYDRWGELVFQKALATPNDPNDGWNGFFNNSLVESGVYIYHFKATFDDEAEPFLYFGDVTVLR